MFCAVVMAVINLHLWYACFGDIIGTLVLISIFRDIITIIVLAVSSAFMNKCC